MFGWTIKISFISLLIIILLHHIIEYFKSMLTVPKIKDLVNNSLEEKYKNMLDIINNNNNNLENNNTSINKEQTDMKFELKKFIKTQLENDNNSDSTTNISIL
jgi:hypothetical protein